MGSNHIKQVIASYESTGYNVHGGGNMAIEGDKTYTLPEVAEILNLKLSNLRYWAQRGQIQAQKVGRAWRMTAESVEHLRTHGTTPAKKGDE